MPKLEIERRFLLKRLPEELQNDSSIERFDIVQYYGKDDIGNFRLRIQRPFPNHTDEVTYIITRKVKVSNMTNEEDETVLDFSEYVNKLSLCKRMLTKIRHIVKEQGLKFEVDQFTSHTLTIMEVEIPTENHVFQIPKIIQPYLIKEITGDKTLSNKNLSMYFR
jgi:CYTH domain-containing protein